METQKATGTRKFDPMEELFECLNLDQQDIDALNYSVGQLVIENLKARLGNEDFTDSGLTRNDLAELGSVLAKLNKLKLYLSLGE